MGEITVSIFCFTYNHESCIGDAIEGFLTQKTNFRYEIIIHDDASTDKTAEIVKAYEQRYPNLIHGIYQVKNQYQKNQPNNEWIWAILSQTCKGKYIAFCEGDDYWIDAQKLQLQVDYLETHPECAMTAHDTIVFDCRNYELKARNQFFQDCVISAEDIILQRIIVPTASIVCRKEMVEMKDFFLNAGVGDYPCLLYALEKGYIYYFSRIMSVYRWYYRNSWSSSMLDIEQNIYHSIYLIDFLQKYNIYTNKKYKMVCIDRIHIQVEQIMTLCTINKVNNFIEICQECNRKSNKKYHELFEQLIKLYIQTFDEKYMKKEVETFIEKNKKVVIMGAGMYASIIANQLRYRKIEFKGFVISDNQKMVNRYLDKPVWKISECPYDIKNIGIIVGINPKIWSEITKTLEKVKAKNYICPFLLS